MSIVNMMAGAAQMLGLTYPKRGIDITVSINNRAYRIGNRIRVRFTDEDAAFFGVEVYEFTGEILDFMGDCYIVEDTGVPALVSEDQIIERCE